MGGAERERGGEGGKEREGGKEGGRKKGQEMKGLLTSVHECLRVLGPLGPNPGLFRP